MSADDRWRPRCPRYAYGYDRCIKVAGHEPPCEYEDFDYPANTRTYTRLDLEPREAVGESGSMKS